MNPIRNYKYDQKNKKAVGFDRGFPLSVLILLGFIGIGIMGLLTGIRQTTDYANARLAYLAARTKAIESMGTEHYKVPNQEDIRALIGEEANENAVIEIIDENRDGNIDYILYMKNNLKTKYKPGETEVEKTKEATS